MAEISSVKVSSQYCMSDCCDIERQGTPRQDELESGKRDR